MAFDEKCSTYWCEVCGAMMDVDYSASNEDGIALKCMGMRFGPVGMEPCDYMRFFVSIGGTKADFEEVTRDDTVDADRLVPRNSDGSCGCELVPGVLGGASDAPPPTDPSVGEDDDEVQDRGHRGGHVEGQG